MIPVALTIAGSDNSAGAGAQADLKTFTALGVYGLTSITCVVAEVPGKVSAIMPVPPEIVAEQVRLSLAAYPIAAAKTGMLYSAVIIEAVAAVLQPARLTLVVDPVMIASSGDPLLEPDAVEAYKRLLFPLATLVTPNLLEAAALWGRPVKTLDDMRQAGRELSACYGCAFLLKGGHLANEAADLLVTSEGQEEIFTAARIPDISTHGTGCTLSAAIAAGLANGKLLPEAVACAKTYITRAIAASHRWQTPEGETQALNHQAHIE